MTTDIQRELISKILKASAIINESKFSGKQNFIVTDDLLNHIRKVHNCDTETAIQIIKNTLEGTNDYLNRELVKLFEENAEVIGIQDLLTKPIIRNDQPYEWLNKMTDEEIAVYRSSLPANGAEAIAKEIDRDILYNLFKAQNENL